MTNQDTEQIIPDELLGGDDHFDNITWSTRYQIDNDISPPTHAGESHKLLFDLPLNIYLSNQIWVDCDLIIMGIHYSWKFQQHICASLFWGWIIQYIVMKMLCECDTFLVV